MDITDYQKIEERFYKILTSGLKKRLALYCLTGSLARKDIILGWSDIDILLVFDTLNEEVVKGVKFALEETKSPVKIGLTFYSTEEFNSVLYKDPKTYQAINLICQNAYKPRILSDKIKLTPNYNTEAFDNVDICKALHTIKRELILGNKHYNEDKVSKLAFMILKIYLRNKKIYVLGYKNILEEAKKSLGDSVFLPLPAQIINNPGDKAKRYLIYIKFLNWVDQHQYWTDKVI